MDLIDQEVGRSKEIAKGHRINLGMALEHQQQMAGVLVCGLSNSPFHLVRDLLQQWVSGRGHEAFEYVNRYIGLRPWGSVLI